MARLTIDLVVLVAPGEAIGAATEATFTNRNLRLIACDTPRAALAVTRTPGHQCVAILLDLQSADLQMDPGVEIVSTESQPSKPWTIALHRPNDHPLPNSHEFDDLLPFPEQPAEWDYLAASLAQCHRVNRQLQLDAVAARNLVIHQPNGLCVLDEAGTIVFANPAAEELFDRHQGDLIGQPFGHPLKHANTTELTVQTRNGDVRQIAARVQRSTWHGAPAWIVGLQEVTEFRHAQRTAERTASLLQEALKMADMGTWEMDYSKNTLHWSSETLHLFGVREAEFSGSFTEFINLVLPEDMPFVEAAWDCVSVDHPIVAAEYRIRRPSDGQIRWMYERGEAKFDSDAKIEKILGVVMDVTERRDLQDQKEDLLKDLTERVKELNVLREVSNLLRRDHLSLPVLLRRVAVSLADAMQFPNLAAARVTFGSLEASTPNFQRPSPCLDTRFTVGQNCVGSLEVGYTEWPPINRPDPYLKEERELVSALAEMLQLYFERREATAAWTESKHREERILQSVGEGIHGLDLEGHIVFENSAGVEMLGWAESELIGQSHEIFHRHNALGQSSPSDPCPIRRTLLDGQIRRIDDEMFIRKDGTLFPVEYVCAAIIGANGNITGAVISFRDITERRWSEEWLRQKLDEERALKLQAVAGEKAKSEFLAVMSHEIRTPMNGVLGFAEMILQANSLAPEHRELCQTIYTSGQALLRILDDILDFSRIEAGYLTIEDRAFSPSELVADVRSLFAQRAAEKGLEFEIHIEDNLPESIKGDAGRVRQILVNLVGNAVKFTTIGSVQLEIRQTAPADDQRFVEFIVRDTGPGIPTTRSSAIFDPFTQADSSISRRHGGTGLGLTISRRLAELMGGSLAILPNTQVGAAFVLSIPLIQALKSEIAPPPEPAIAVPLNASFAKAIPLRILIAEDDRVNLKLIARMLKTLGYDPLVARNGLEAVALCESQSPDFIFMDLQMPEIDGLEATIKIREFEASNAQPRTFISALTANILPEDRQRCLSSGMDAYLNKPVKIRSVTDILLQAWESRNASQPCATQSPETISS